MSTTLEQSQYGFDRDSRRIWQRRSLTDTQDQQYNYDALGQVGAAARGSLNLNMTAISGIPASAQSWDYDPTGNWRGYHTAANGTPTLDQHRVHDRGNRLTQIEDNPNNMILDRVGRMRQMAPDAEGDWYGTLELTWDAWSRITSVKNNGTVVGGYSYDGTHRRTTRQVGSYTLHSYYNDEWRPVEERKDSETTATLSYLWGSRHRDDLVRRDRAVSGTTLNEPRYVLMDYFNPAAITDESGTVKERYAFSAFGVRSILNPDFTARSTSECAMEFAFQGQFLDAESGLLNYGYRYYSPQLGRWTCKDPIGERGGINLYTVTNNEPQNHVDKLGLECPPAGYAMTGWDHDPDPSNFFKGVAAAGNRQAGTGMTGQDLLNFLKGLTQSCCCISDLVLASHGGKRGIGGSAPGEAGFINGLVWSHETGQRTAAVHLQNMVNQGDIQFCPNCKIAVHGCQVGAEFAEELARVSGCTVVHAQAGCSAMNGNPENPWHSDAPGFNQMSPDGTSKPIGGTYDPNAK